MTQPITTVLAKQVARYSRTARVGIVGPDSIDRDPSSLFVLYTMSQQGSGTLYLIDKPKPSKYSHGSMDRDRTEMEKVIPTYRGKLIRPVYLGIDVATLSDPAQVVATGCGNLDLLIDHCSISPFIVEETMQNHGLTKVDTVKKILQAYANMLNDNGTCLFFSSGYGEDPAQLLQEMESGLTAVRSFSVGDSYSNTEFAGRFPKFTRVLYPAYKVVVARKAKS